MNLEIQDGYKRVLVLEKGESAKCNFCGEHWDYIYFCEQSKILYCKPCLIRKRSCRAYRNHTDYKLDAIEIEEKNGRQILKNLPSM